ncbi:MAG: NAD+ synthase [Candidatus Puniceispirillaceae bacterium]
MTRKLRVALAQFNPLMGDINGNFERLCALYERAKGQEADVLLTPEMALTGYPCDDLVLRADFMEKVAQAVSELARLTADGGPAILLGAPHQDSQTLTNSVFVLDEGAIQTRRDKVQLPNYGVFDEKRHFTAGAPAGPVQLRGVRIGLAICEDIWSSEVAETLAESGAEMILSLNASPFDITKSDSRLAHAAARRAETDLPVFYVNMVGGQDELVFDGGSFVLDGQGKLVAQMPLFSEGLGLVSCVETAGQWQITGQISKPAEGEAALYGALMLGVRDYVEKNGFPGVVLGLSGGVDSALVAMLAVDALGPERVKLVMMPSRYTADISKTDADKLAENLGVELDTITIAPAMAVMDELLDPHFDGRAADITEENIQSRLRGLLLMGLSNKLGHMVLATGNKSEYAVGYATLYGDMCGGYAPLKDVWKLQVFALCNWRNGAMPRGGLGPEVAPIPSRIITRPPSAELRDDQEDTDSLPAYEMLDPILQALTEEMVDCKTIIERGFDSADVMRASALLFRAEYKRFQAAPGPKVSVRAFGRDRRLPLTSHYRPDGS